MSVIQRVALAFTVIGAISWGLIGIFSFDFIAALFGDGSVLTRIIYSIVGVAGLVNLCLLFKSGDVARGVTNSDSRSL